MLCEASVCLNVFQFGDSLNLLPLSLVSSQTSGYIRTFPPYQDELYYNLLYLGLQRFVTENYGSDVVAKIRCQNGINFVNYYAPSGLKVQPDLLLNGFAQDQQIICQFNLNENLKQEKVFFQFAFLFTTYNGERILRIFNSFYFVTQEPRVFFDYLNQEMIYLFLSREILFSNSKYNRQ